MLKTASQIADDVIQKLAGGRPSQAEINRMKSFGQQQGQVQRQRSLQSTREMAKSIPAPSTPSFLNQPPKRQAPMR